MEPEQTRCPLMQAVMPCAGHPAFPCLASVPGSREVARAHSGLSTGLHCWLCLHRLGEPLAESPPQPCFFPGNRDSDRTHGMGAGGLRTVGFTGTRILGACGGPLDGCVLCRCRFSVSPVLSLDMSSPRHTPALSVLAPPWAPELFNLLLLSP